MCRWAHRCTASFHLVTARVRGGGAPPSPFANDLARVRLLRICRRASLRRCRLLSNVIIAASARWASNSDEPRPRCSATPQAIRSEEAPRHSPDRRVRASNPSSDARRRMRIHASPISSGAICSNRTSRTWRRACARWRRADSSPSGVVECTCGACAYDMSTPRRAS
jgi:hypothetical protein